MDDGDRRALKRAEVLAAERAAALQGAVDRFRASMTEHELEEWYATADRIWVSLASRDGGV